MPACATCGTEIPTGALFCPSCGAPVAGAAAHREQRKTVTVLFCDVVGSTALGESTDPEALRALLARYFERIAPEGSRDYIHTIEGPDDMPAHIRSVLTGVQLSISLIGGSLALGTWQGIYLFEHRAAPHRRFVAAHLLGE